MNIKDSIVLILLLILGLILLILQCCCFIRDKKQPERKPDLTVTEIKVDKELGIFYTQIKNVGEAPSDPFQVHFVVYRTFGKDSLKSEYTQWQKVKGLNANEEYVIVRYLFAEPSVVSMVSQGLFDRIIVYVRVDAEEDVDESDEKNNLTERHFKFAK